MADDDEFVPAGWEKRLSRSTGKSRFNKFEFKPKTSGSIVAKIFYF